MNFNLYNPFQENKNKTTRVESRIDNFWLGDIEKQTIENVNYRQVLTTTPQMQLVLMSLLPEQEIGWEKHDFVTQFIRIEKGQGILKLKNFVPQELKDGFAFVIPAGTYHNVVNSSKKDTLKLYSLYSPPEHPKFTLQKFKR